MAHKARTDQHIQPEWVKAEQNTNYILRMGYYMEFSHFQLAHRFSGSENITRSWKSSHELCFKGQKSCINLSMQMDVNSHYLALNYFTSLLSCMTNKGCSRDPQMGYKQISHQRYTSSTNTFKPWIHWIKESQVARPEKDVRLRPCWCLAQSRDNTTTWVDKSMVYVLDDFVYSVCLYINLL